MGQKPDGEQEVVIVTGSSGLIGHATASRFVEDYDVMGFDRIKAPHPPPETEYIVFCDLTSPESVRQAMREVRNLRGDLIASVIHLAAYYDFSGEPSPLYEEVTVKGTQRLLEELENFTVEQFIFSSTMLVHAPCQPGRKIDEDWPLDPKWAYPQSKVRTENVIRENSGDIPIVLLRIAGVYNDFCHAVPLAQQMARIRERDITATVYPGDLTHGQSFMHLSDLVDALKVMVDRRADLPPETIMLLGEDEVVSYGELQREFARLLLGEDDWQTHHIPKPLAKTGARLQDTALAEAITGEEAFIKPWMIDIADDHYDLDISRARKLLDWQPQHSLRESLPEMASTLKHDPAAWYEKNGLQAPQQTKQDETEQEMADA